VRQVRSWVRHRKIIEARLSVGEVIRDRGEISGPKATRRGGDPQRPVNHVDSDERGQLSRLCHLGAHAFGSRCRGLDEPLLGTVTEGQECPLMSALRAGARVKRIAPERSG